MIPARQIHRKYNFVAPEAGPFTPRNVKPHPSRGHALGLQVVLLLPGRTCGALEVTSEFKRSSIPNVIVGEAQTPLHSCRLVDEASTQIFAVKPRVAVSALNPRLTSVIVDCLPKKLMKQVVAALNILETSLGNVGMILHCAPMLANLEAIGSGKLFRFYSDGITAAVAALMEQLDRERLAVAAACDLSIVSVTEWLKQTYNISGESLYKCVQNDQAYSTILSPATLKHR